ncbi:MAG: S41 family peptidase [Bryobacteraceae bacterium]
MRVRYFTQLALLLCCAAGVVRAQLSQDQKVFEFQVLASFVAKEYAPYEWKRDVIGFDALEVRPWLERVREAPDDLAYFEICAEYVASLQDLHMAYFVPSDFRATIPLGVDLNDGKALIDEINRTVLPRRTYDFEIGDELISVDGVTAEEWIRRVSRLLSLGNSQTTRRFSLSTLFDLRQSMLPRAHEIGDEATVVIRKANGEIASYRIEWIKAGTPLLRVGPTLTPKLTSRNALWEEVFGEENAPAPGEAEEAEPVNYVEKRAPSYLRPLYGLRDRSLPESQRIRRLGSIRPAFDLPPGFRLRLGRGVLDFFFSGVIEQDGARIGFIRIPTFSLQPGFAQFFALQQFASEVAFLDQNTDGLIVDVMRNAGGDICYTEELLSHLIPQRFVTVGDEIRPTLPWLINFRRALEEAKEDGAEQWVIDMLGVIVRDLETAYGELRGRTGPLSVCSLSLEVLPATDQAGRNIAYTKPLIVLTDGFTMSAAEMFAAIIQDNRRGLVLSTRTPGGGALSRVAPTGFFSEVFAQMSVSMAVRPAEIATPDFPTTRYIENVGVRPDIEIEFMTGGNLANGGRMFLEEVLAAARARIR